MSADLSLRDRLQDAVKTAMKARDTQRLTVLRMATAAVKQREIDDQVTLDETGVLAVLEKMVKQRRDAAEQFTAGGREDLAAIERFEISVLEGFLPEKLSEAELTQLIQAQIATLPQPVGPASMGAAMAAIKPLVAGKADMGVVSRLLGQLLKSAPTGG